MVKAIRYGTRLLLIASLCVACGCSSIGHLVDVVSGAPQPPDRVIAPDKELLFPERLSQGYTLYLPGIFGSNKITVVQGLKKADVPTAIEFFDWTTGPAFFVYNHLNRPRNRLQAKKAAAKLVAYQQMYPGRPVHVVGYSGGGTMAVMTLEALPPGVRVTNAVVIASTMGSNYDLRPAMSHTEQGINNFYSYVDVPMLETFCLLTGTGDGKYGLTSGLVGFYPPKSLSPAERVAYNQGLHQQPFDLSMLKDGHWGGHFGWIGPVVLAHHIAPLLETPASNNVQTAAAGTTPELQQPATAMRFSASAPPLK